MRDRRKWLTRVGSLLILLGFVFPSMLVSCSGMTAVQESLSLMDVAELANTPSLYLALLTIIAIPILSVLRENRLISRTPYLWSVLGFGVGSLIIIAAVVSYLESQVRTMGAFEFSPDYGMFFLVAGYIILGIGIYNEWQIPDTHQVKVVNPQLEQDLNPPLNLNNGSYPYGEQKITGTARLRLIQGSSPMKNIVLTDLFAIGREKDNSLVLPDTSVSRRHACFRVWEGTWFLQDQNSTGGTYVNGQLIQALRLNSGDRITIGNTTFIFELT